MSKTQQPLKLELRLESLNPRKTTARLIEEIEAAKDDLLLALKDDDATDIAIQPERALSGTEIIIVAFLIGFGKGVAGGVGNELGKPVGQKIGRWIKSKFGDVKVEVEAPASRN